MDNLNTMLDLNVISVDQLLQQFKKYEYILNVDKKALVDDLFKGGEDGAKKPLADIKEAILHYQQAHYEIMTLAENTVNLKIYRVNTQKMKKDLGDQALKIKNQILESAYAYCNESIGEINRVYMEMSEKISHDPLNEKELILTREHIDAAPAMVEKNQILLEEVYKHILMLEEFSFMYKEHEIDTYWYMKVWPMRIQVCVQDGKAMITEKNESFGARLENEKDAFTKQLKSSNDAFTKIQEF
jgi:hypothetical protein